MSTFKNSMIKYFVVKNKIKTISVLSIPKREGKKKGTKLSQVAWPK